MKNAIVMMSEDVKRKNLSGLCELCGFSFSRVIFFINLTARICYVQFNHSDIIAIIANNRSY
jgi:hypothetical protein